MKDQLTARIAELDKQISALKNERDKCDQQLAELNTEFKVGDRVTYEGAGKVWEVRAVLPGGWRSAPRLFGAKLKKDGTPGAVCNEIWIPYNRHLVLANAELRGCPPQEPEKE